MALEGMDIEVHDIDIRTDQNGADGIESKFSEYVTEPVRYSQSEQYVHIPACLKWMRSKSKS